MLYPPLYPLVVVVVVILVVANMEHFKKNYRHLLSLDDDNS